MDASVSDMINNATQFFFGVVEYSSSKDQCIAKITSKLTTVCLGKLCTSRF